MLTTGKIINDLFLFSVNKNRLIKASQSLQKKYYKFAFWTFMIFYPGSSITFSSEDLKYLFPVHLIWFTLFYVKEDGDGEGVPITTKSNRNEI